MICCAVIACKKNEINFTYSPQAPRAGQQVNFTNLSTTGEDWSWTFGDGGSSTVKTPSHTYRNPGTYRVILKVDNKAYLTATADLTVYDTVPTFVCEDSVFYIFKDYTFTANLYNPYNYEVEYLWDFPLNTIYAVSTDTTMMASTLHIYFTQALSEAPVTLRIVVNGDTTLVQKSFEVLDRTTNSILLRTEEGDFRQRIFGDRIEDMKRDATATPLLDAEQDTEQWYNDSLFVLSELQATFPEMQGFHIANRKIYYRANGLWVANIDGAYPVQIDEQECYAMTLDLTDNRIYWVNAEGLWYLPFIGSDNNKFVTTPTLINNTTILKIAADSELK